MRYRLRTLLIVLAILPPLASWTYIAAMKQAALARRKALRESRQALVNQYRAGTIPLVELEKHLKELDAEIGRN